LPTASGFQASVVKWRPAWSRAHMLLAGNDFRQVLELVRSLLLEIEALDLPSTGAEHAQRWSRVWFSQLGAVSEYQLGNLAASEAHARSAVENWQALPGAGLGHELVGAQFKTLLAQAIARQGRVAESMEILRPLLEFFREQHSQPHENLMLDFWYAHALYAAALAEPAERAARLAEATAILDGLPPAMSHWKTGELLRAWIAQARGQSIGAG
jgi:hypothetical protein